MPRKVYCVFYVPHNRLAKRKQIILLFFVKHNLQVVLICAIIYTYQRKKGKEKMENKRRIQIILPNHILDDLDKEATNLGLNRTTLIIQILSQYQTAKIS